MNDNECIKASSKKYWKTILKENGRNDTIKEKTKQKVMSKNKKP